MEDNEDQLKKRCIELNNIELEIRIKQTELDKLKEQKRTKGKYYSINDKKS